MDEVCDKHNVYEFLKIKDFDSCLTNPLYRTLVPPAPLRAACPLNGIDCGQSIQRSTVYKYIGCGPSADQLTIARVEGLGELFIKPFAAQTERIANTAISSLIIQKKHKIIKLLTSPSQGAVHDNLGYTFTETDIKDDVRMNSTTSFQSALHAIRQVARELRESSTSERDTIERLSIVCRSMSAFSSNQLKSMWLQVKSNDSVIQ